MSRTLVPAMLLGGLLIAQSVAPSIAPAPRRALAAAELAGRIYIAGGWNGDATQLALVESVDPLSLRLRLEAPLALARSQHGLVALGERLWVVAGWSAERGLVPELESWAPGESAWRVESRLPTPRREPGVAVFGRHVVVAGGFDGASDMDLDGYSAAVEAYDVTTGQWRVLPSLRIPRRGLALVNAGGRLYAIGGYNAHDGFVNAVERYEPDAGAWRSLDWAIAPRTWLAAVADGDAIVLLGGHDAGGPLDLVERVRSDDGAVCRPPPLRVARSWLAAAPLGHGRAMTFGGETREGFSNDVTVHSISCRN